MLARGLRKKTSHALLSPFVLLPVYAVACSSGDGTEPNATGGAAPATGGAMSGGSNNSDGGTSAGGMNTATGGTIAGVGGMSLSTGGMATGGTTTGGASSSQTGGAEGDSGGAPANVGGSDVGVGGSLPGAGGSAPTSLLFSTDFETDAVGDVAPGGMPWTTTLPTEYDSGGIVEVTTAVPAHSGSNSVYVKKGNNGTGFLQMQGAPVFPFSSDKIHVRAYIRVSAWPDNHTSWMEIGAVTNEENELRWGAHQGVLQVNHWPGDQDQIAEGVSLSVGDWHCIEYSYEPSTLTMEVYLEEAKIDALTVVGSFERGGAFTEVPIEALRFGAEINTDEAWFDDIAVSDSFIGCL